MRVTKRALFVGGLLATLGASLTRAATRSTMPSIADDLSTYIGFGVKASGGEGDNASGAWIEKRLAELGFEVSRQTFDVPFFEPVATSITVGDATVPLVPLLPVKTTGADGREGAFVIARADAPDATTIDSGSVVALVLPHRRWSTAAIPLVQNAIKVCFAKGAAAIVFVTTGPTGEAIALNVSPDAIYDGPVGVIGSNDLVALAKAGRNPRARATLDGKTGKRSAFNVIATSQPERSPRIVVSTPRSGWGVCAGERGPGVAAYLAVAALIAERKLPVTFVCTSGHEFENLGGHHFLRHEAPKIDAVSLWLHLGANLAARDWHETGAGLAPLPSADPQRILMASEDMLPIVREAFAGLPGLEAPYKLSAEAQGELKEIRAAGYTRALGIFGAHRYHHTKLDDQRCVRAELVAPVVQALAKVIDRAF